MEAQDSGRTLQGDHVQTLQGSQGDDQLQRCAEMSGATGITSQGARSRGTL